VNLDPHVVEPGCFDRLEAELEGRLAEVREAAISAGSQIVLSGILPTLGKSDMSLANITPRPRYLALNDALNRMRGKAYQLRIEGAEELFIEHDSVMLEACNTSWQVHMQLGPEEFAPLYNAAQLALGPVVAVATNSPLLFGKRLWSETRIALFQQSLDTRPSALHTREMSPRVHFGNRWVEHSVNEIFEEDVARFRPLVTRPNLADAQAVFEAGGGPELEALQIHNSTVYRWNRPCYGVNDGIPHLRIECRALPSGPSVKDEVANAAFWVGLTLGLAQEIPDLHQQMPFADAKANFLAASRLGLDAGLLWPGAGVVPAARLLEERLLPIAEAGLTEAGLSGSEVDERLGLIRERAASGRTGASWLVESLRGMTGPESRSEHLRALTRATIARQLSGEPVHRWELAQADEAQPLRGSDLRVEQHMTTSLFTVHEDESLDLAAFLMDRQHIRHVLVEDDEHRLVGLVSYRSLLRLLANGELEGEGIGIPVRGVMEPDPLTVSPETLTREAIELMRTRRISCLPVVSDGKLVGIVSERDFLSLAYRLLAPSDP
jgi:CBS domain-containing protein/gamma-glutamylcysteine synthetase